MSPMRVSLPSDSNLLRGHVTQNVGCCAVSRKQFHGSVNVYCLIFFLLVFSSRLFLLLLRQRCDPKEAAGAKSEFTPEAPRLLYGSVPRDPTTFLPAVPGRTTGTMHPLGGALVDHSGQLILPVESNKKFFKKLKKK